MKDNPTNPFWWEYIPEKRLALLLVHSGAVVKKFVKRTPLEAILSRFGLLTSSCP
jgi:hypothetical protein